MKGSANTGASAEGRGAAGTLPAESYGGAAIRENRLERWPNPEPGRPYLVSMDIPEFTCLCPRSGFPDFALIKVRYQPREWIVELKSLKLYVNGYRDRAISHEAATNQILDDLVGLLEPRWMRVTADFNVRGNIKTVVRAEHGTRERP
jgi:7-cyano-7-deazaguanine reductase